MNLKFYNAKLKKKKNFTKYKKHCILLVFNTFVITTATIIIIVIIIIVKIALN